MADDARAKENVYWIPVSKIRPNQYQPRTEFDEAGIKGLAESIRQYGILQPLIVTRYEEETPLGTSVSYELVAGERRFRAAESLGLPEVPVIIRRDEPARVRLELALVENVQRKDLNPLERARAYKRLIDEFQLSYKDLASRIGKSREAVINTVRILALPEYILETLKSAGITEGHTRPLLMLSDRPEEQRRLFDEIIGHKISVREAERISRHIAHDRARKPDEFSSERTRAIEEKLQEVFGTRVLVVQERGGRGKISIEFFSDEELDDISGKLATKVEEVKKEEPPLQQEDKIEEVSEHFTV